MYWVCDNWDVLNTWVLYQGLAVSLTNTALMHIHYTRQTKIRYPQPSITYTLEPSKYSINTMAISKGVCHFGFDIIDLERLWNRPLQFI